MASGDQIASVIRDVIPTSAIASKDVSSENLVVYDFDDSTSETARFLCYMSGQYDGTSNIRVTIPWNFVTYVGSQTVDWEVSFCRLADNTSGDSIDSFTFATAQTDIFTEPSAAGLIDYASITFTNAQADGVQPNEYFILKVTRDATGGTASPGDARMAIPVITLA